MTAGTESGSLPVNGKDGGRKKLKRNRRRDKIRLLTGCVGGQGAELFQCMS